VAIKALVLKYYDVTVQRLLAGKESIDFPGMFS